MKTVQFKLNPSDLSPTFTVVVTKSVHDPYMWSFKFDSGFFIVRSNEENLVSEIVAAIESITIIYDSNND